MVVLGFVDLSFIDLGSIVGIIFFSIGCPYLKRCVIFWRTQWQLRTRGIIVQGEVIERHMEYDIRAHLWFYITCRYSYEAQTYISDQPVWRKHYASEEVPVSVCCLPDNPEVAIVFGNDFLRTEWIPRTIVPVIFVLLGVTLFIAGFPFGAFTALHP